METDVLFVLGVSLLVLLYLKSIQTRLGSGEHLSHKIYKGNILENNIAIAINIRHTDMQCSK